MMWIRLVWRGHRSALTVPGTAGAQVFNYDPYDDSDLLGDFERPKKLHFGMNINVVKAGGASSVFYNGTGSETLGDVFRELISIPERLDWNSVAGGSGNTARNRIAQDLGHRRCRRDVRGQLSHRPALRCQLRLRFARHAAVQSGERHRPRFGHLAPQEPGRMAT